MFVFLVPKAIYKLRIYCFVKSVDNNIFHCYTIHTRNSLFFYEIREQFTNF